MSGSICLTLQQDGGFFVLEAVRVQDYPKYNSEKRVGQIPGSTQVYRCTTVGLAQLTYISQVIYRVTGHRVTAWMGPFRPAEHGPSSFTSRCCIPFHIPCQGGRDDSLDLKVEDAPCPLWICSEIFGIKLSWHCFHSGISLVMGIPHLMPSLLSLAYLLYWHFLFKDRPAVIRVTFPLLVTLPY